MAHPDRIIGIENLHDVIFSVLTADFPFLTDPRTTAGHMLSDGNSPDGKIRLALGEEQYGTELFRLKNTALAGSQTVNGGEDFLWAERERGKGKFSLHCEIKPKWLPDGHIIIQWEGQPSKPLHHKVFLRIVGGMDFVYYPFIGRFASRSHYGNGLWDHTGYPKLKSTIDKMATELEPVCKSNIHELRFAGVTAGDELLSIRFQDAASHDPYVLIVPHTIPSFDPKGLMQLYPSS